MNFKKEYEENLLKELEQILFLCSKKDATILLSKPKQSEITEFVRLACIALVLGYKKVLLLIIARIEKYFDLFIKELEGASRDFAKIDKWFNDFIENIENSEVKKMTYVFWAEQKSKTNTNNFNINQLLN